MASTSDGRQKRKRKSTNQDMEVDVVKKKKPIISSFKQPTVIEQLKYILAEYPDGGQILKAPALCVHNDAEFTEQDWKGIIMIYNSVKKFDILKVGRFGLGFKSVFHLTDNPCIISGKRMLLMDPLHPAGCEPAPMEIGDLGEMEGFDTNAFIQALDGKFGFDRETLSSGYFRGTLFWFPLREIPNTLSDNVYTVEKVMNLFRAFQQDSSSILLFLKSLSEVTLFTDNQSQPQERKVYAKVKIADSGVKCLAQRAAFADKVSSMTPESADISSIMEVPIECFFDGSSSSNTTWLVVNYVVSESASDELNRLMNDESIGLSPYVGVAAPMTTTSQFNGHIFCFLPLPKEGSKLTGLPFHVNGFFALSSNRHHLKWETDEDKNQQQYDKNVHWNHLMTSEVLPRAYRLMYNAAVSRSNISGNSEKDVKRVYGLVPDLDNVNENWKSFATKSMKCMQSECVVFANDVGRWDVCQKCVFGTTATFDTEEIKTSVRSSMIRMGKSYAELDETSLKTLQMVFTTSVICVSPNLITYFLQESNAYQCLADEMKTDLLVYISADKQFDRLQGLELLPLANGTWVSFRKEGNAIYLASVDEIEIFPDFKDRFVMATRTSKSGKAFKAILEEGSYRISNLSTDALLTFLRESLQSFVDTEMKNSSKFSLPWLEKVWSLVMKYGLEHFKDLRLLPLLQEGTFDGTYVVKLVTLTYPFVLSRFINVTKGFNENVKKALQLLGITVLEDLPNWLPKTYLNGYVSQLNHYELRRCFDTIEEDNVLALSTIFNSKADDETRKDFVKYLCCSEEDYRMSFLEELEIFKMISKTKGCEKYARLKMAGVFIDEKTENELPRDIDIPIECFRRDKTNRRLITMCDILELTTEKFVKIKMQEITKSGYASDTDVFMKFFLKNTMMFKPQTDIIQMASNIAFIKHDSKLKRASNFFDHTDANLKKLFLKQDVFLPEQVFPTRFLDGLRTIGLKSAKCVSADDLFSIAQVLDSFNSSGVFEAEINDKAKAFLNTIESNPNLLQNIVHVRNKTTSLGEALRTLQCFPCINNDIGNVEYPRALLIKDLKHLYCPTDLRDSRYSMLIGSIKPLISSYCIELAEFYEWTKPPSIEDLIENLNVVKGRFVDTKYDVAKVTKAIYSELARQKDDVAIKKEIFEEMALIWTEKGFTRPSRTILKQNVGDILLSPYFEYIPDEFNNVHNLLESLGSHPIQDRRVLTQLLQEIQKKYPADGVDLAVVSYDKKLVRDVLEKLATLNTNDEADREWMKRNVLIMIDTNDKHTIEFDCISKCVYDKERDMFDDSDEEEKFKYVHPSCIEHAMKLGVKSVTRQSLMDAEDIEDWGQNERLTTRLNRLLKEDYVDGLSVPKELIQNADDAGATEISFLYDERDHIGYRKRLISKEMSECQGASLFVYNNTTFSEDDFKNITRINEGTKQHDTSTIGKFGLGFCSVYNVTDVPSLVSGQNMVIFDPHERYLDEKNPKRGIKLPLSKRTLVKRHVDQFMPFEGLFGCSIVGDSFTPFEGTLFRLQLRTAVQADKSEISKKVYNKDEVFGLLKMLRKHAGDLLLFSQNVTTIRIFHLRKDYVSSDDVKPVFEMNKSIIGDTSSLKDRFSVLKLCSQTHQTVEHVQVVSLVTQVSSSELFEASTTDNNDTRFVISWYKCPEDTLKCTDETAIPVSAIAIPDIYSDKGVHRSLSEIGHGFYNEGHLFCFMPLPVITNLPFHINGFFSVTQNRRGLSIATEDDKTDNSYHWNDSLLSKCTVQSFIKYLRFLAEFYAFDQTASDTQYYETWPDSGEQAVEQFVKAFYITVLQDDPHVFRSNESQLYLPFSGILVLNDEIRNNETLYANAFEFVKCVPITYSRIVVNLPRKQFHKLVHYNRDASDILDVVITEEMLIIHLLDNMNSEYWIGKTDVRNVMLLHAISYQNKTVQDKLKRVSCIPTQPNERLRKIDELVHPNTELARLFLEEEERFVIKTAEFRDSKLLNRLVELGMMCDTLTEELLINRCKSVEMLSQKCSVCTMSRIDALLFYMNTRISNIKPSVVTEIGGLSILPVQTRLPEWLFSFQSEKREDMKTITDDWCHEHKTPKQTVKVLIGRPCTLYESRLMYAIGSVECVVDIRCEISQALSKLLGIRSQENLTANVLLQQLNVLADEYKCPELSFSAMTEQIVNQIYSELDNVLTKPSLIENLKCVDKKIKYVFDKKIIMIGKSFYHVKQVAMHMDTDCSPELCVLHNMSDLKLRLFRKLGVKEHFVIEDIIAVMKRKSLLWKEKPCKEVKLMINLLRNLHSIMERENITIENLQQHKDFIVAPDEKNILAVTSELALEDQAVFWQRKVRLVHGDVPPNIAKAVGVKSKKASLIKGFSSGISFFGQKEQLTTRLNGLLKDYPSDVSIFKEFIQNADDAGATEINFIKFFRTQKIAHSIGQNQTIGPALCIYNDAHFTDRDLEGIRNLGIGSKTDDPTKTGQYGLGFNAVYHITDTPSFYSKGPGLGKEGVLCIFDPLFKEIPELDEPGIKCDINEMDDQFKDILKGYPGIKSDVGTMFRLPLRQEKSEISVHCFGESEIDILLGLLQEEASTCLQFLKNLKSIAISTFIDGKVQTNFIVEAILTESDEMKRKQYFDDVNIVCKKHMYDKYENILEDRFSVTYNLSIVENNEPNKRWLVCNQFSSNTKPDEEKTCILRQAFTDGDLGLMPTVGISIPVCEIGNSESTEAHKAFCFLPLPIRTGLPFHVNGHFSTDRGRRMLINSGVGESWNKYLLSGLLPEALCTSLLEVQSILCKEGMTEATLKERLGLYNAIFPRYLFATDINWKYYVQNMYKMILDKKCKLFPTLFSSDSQDKTHGFKLLWTHLARSEADKTGGIFYTMHSMHKVLQNPVKSIMMRIGMKIVESSDIVKQSIEEVKLKVFSCSPGLALKYILETDVKISGLHIEQSCFTSVEHFKELISFIIRCNQFERVAEGLPLCLTQDQFLQKFDSNNPVFCSMYVSLIPGSSNEFMHKDIVSYFKKKNYLFERGVLKELSVHDLHSRLSFSYNETDYHGGNDLDVESFLLKDTGIDLIMFFKFLHEKSVKSNQLFSVDQFVANVSHFKSWSFLPTRCTANGCAFKYLIPLDQPNKLYKGENSYENIHLIISKLNIPTLDTSWLPSDTNSTNWDLDIKRGLESMIASVLNPVKLISCLNIYKEKLQGRVTHLEAVDILGYISERIAASNCHADLDFMIRSLPLYETVFGDLISIENVNNVVILSKRIPPNGMKEIAEATNTTFVMFHERYSYLLKQFSPSLEVDGLYADIIVPNFRAIPPKHQLKHLEYIRDHICRDGTEASRSKQQIRRLLTNNPFIQIGNRKRRVNEFYSHRHAVFAKMLTDDEFLPKHLRTDEWKKFLDALGLITMPTQQKVLEFAKTIALDSASNADLNTDVLKEKSQTLTSFILTAGHAFFSSSNLQELKNIKFVNSHVVDDERRALYHSFIKSNEFICFNGSTTSDWQEICWSSTPILHSAFQISLDERRQELGVLTYPSVERVIVHSHNVTEVFHNEFKRKIAKTHDKMKFITPLYDFFMKHLNSPELAKLRNSYFVHIPNEAMVRADMVFEISALKSTEIKPYLYELPKPLRKYIDLFEKLGTMSVVCRSQFVNVLGSIHTEYSDQTLPPQVLKKVAQTITLLFKLDGPLEDNHSKLFLPNKEMKLKESSSLTVCDNNTYADILRYVADIDYFLGFQEMEIDEFTPAVFESLPDSMQPCFLSKDVRESVSLESIEVVESLVSYDWQYFLRSDCLINGIIRLIRAQCGFNYKGNPTTDLEDRSRKKLKNVRINQVNGLQTKVSYKGSVLDGVSLQRICYTKNINCINGNTSFQLYFDSMGATDETMIISEEDGIFHLVQKCTEHILDKDKCCIMSALLNYRNTPERISELLDRSEIAQIDFKPSSVFPKPGTYVNSKFYPFLVQEIVTFDEHEYEFVAMEVEYEDDENNAYIYVHIISQIPKLADSSNIRLRYKVNAGEPRGFIEVPIFKLFRFVSPNPLNTYTEVELYDSQNIITLPFDENRQRVRDMLTAAFQMVEKDRRILIKRLLLRWHPDRNSGLEDYAKEIFNFIKELIVELEKNEHAVRSSGTFSSSTFRSRYYNFSTRIECKGRVFAQEFHQRKRHYYAYFTSGYNTSSSNEYVPVPNIGEAKRWLRQAKTDFHVASGMLANPEEGFKGFNWICYQLHQACEKALKAARFSRDANRCPRWSHNLCSIADGIEIDDIKEKVRLFESRLNISDRQYFRLRYPDAVEMNKLPSDVFSLDDAAFAKETAHEIIAFVEDYIYPLLLFTC
ncbi:SACS-like protein [Mya arenaria]|uniref:SACS-like protein n=1 Tax=Mya arenaria TaxID=6604 RepID=A0ABY7EPV6_MYAAR|nr:SACS-like protein [Mya arenaria]